MKTDWSAIFKLSAAMLASAPAEQDSTVRTGTALRRQMGLKLDPVYQRSDIKDAVMTFMLVFTGAMVFLL